MMHRFLLIASIVFPSMANAVVASRCPSVNADSFCPQGCWHESGIVSGDGSRSCAVVGTGHYSPRNDDQRYPCEFGSASNVDHAEACATCPAGTHASVASLSDCQVCPQGTYSGAPQSAYCIPCDPSYYAGEGANSMQVWNGQVYCFLSTLADSLTEIPSATPTTYPSESPSFALSVTDASNRNDTLAIVIDISSSEHQCEDGEFDWHGQCNPCPSTVRALLHPLWVLMFVVGVLALLHHLAPCCLATLWMGLEYLQLVYFLSITPVPSNFIMDRVHGILSVFALDLDGTFSAQCLLGASVHFEQLWTLVLPMLIGAVLWVLSKIFKSMPDITRWMAVGLYLGYFKLILTSLEALECSPSSWFCRDPMLASVTGTVGLTIYGLGFPLWLIWNLRKEAVQADLNESHWIRQLPFQPSCWWWAGVFVVRKAVLVVVLQFFFNSPPLVLTGVLVAIIVTEMVQRCVSPFPEDCDGKSRWFQNAMVDMVLQACLICLAGLKLLSLAAPEEDTPHTIISIVFLVLWIPSVLYWIAAFLHCHFSCSCHGNDEKSSLASVTTSNSSNKGKSESDREIHLTASSSSSSTEEAEMDIPPSLSMVPHPGSTDDDDRKTGLDVDDEEALQGWQETQEYEEWAVTGDSVMHDCLRKSPSPKQSYSHDESALDHADSYEVSTLTNPSKSYSFDDTTMNHVHVDDLYDHDDEESTLDETMAKQTSKTHICDDEYTCGDEYTLSSEYDDDMTEIWIDEATGMPVDKHGEQWTDAETGLRADYQGQGNTQVLDTAHRVEPFTWGRRQSSVYQPN